MREIRRCALDQSVIGDGVMVLAIHELLELDKIGQALSKDDPELARKLAGPHGFARQLRTVLSYVTPAVCTLIFFVGARAR